MPVVVVPKYASLGRGFSRAEQLKADEHPGRRTDGTQTAATWVTTLSDLKKLILLCSFCRGRFNPRKHGYRKFYTPDITGATDGYTSNGVCDGCKQRTENCGGGVAFVHEETYNLTCVDPAEVRRRARLAARRSEIEWGVTPRRRR